MIVIIHANFNDHRLPLTCIVVLETLALLCQM